MTKVTSILRQSVKNTDFLQIAGFPKISDIYI